jgi:hypothetical protein
MRGRLAGRNSGSRGSAAIAGNRKLAGVRRNQPTAHGFEMREHRDDAGEMASPTMRFTRAGKVTNAVAAMADGEELAGARENVPTSHDLKM